MSLSPAAALLCLMLQNFRLLPSFAATTCWDEPASAAETNISCEASRPFLIFGHGKAIFRMDMDGKNQRRLVARVGTSILLDFHFGEKRVYWAEKHSGFIYTASAGSHRQKVFSSDKHISGLAVDWIWNTVYWTSEEKGRIRRINTNGTNKTTILRRLNRPSSIVIDANKSFLFWVSGGMSPGVQRSEMNGQKRTTLRKLVGELTTLTIDLIDKRLFWVQVDVQTQSTIVSSDYNGHALHIIDQPLGFYSLAISIFQDQIFYIDGEARAIKRVNKYTGGPSKSVNPKHLAKSPVGIKVIHSSKQPPADPPTTLTGCDERSGNCVDVCSGQAEMDVCQCSDGFVLSKQGAYCEDVNECAHWNHGCSLGCENIPGSYFCTCPQGYTLLSDRKTCREIIACEGNTSHCGHGCLETEEGVICICPQDSVLTEDGQSCTGCSSADRGGCSQTCTSITPDRWRCGCLPGYLLQDDGRRCVAAGPRPYLLVANLLGILQVNPDATGEKTIVEETRGAVVALDYDPVHKHVYFASSSRQRIERVDMDGRSRVQLVSEAEVSPEALTVDWIHGRIYWTDKSHSTVDCCHLDGMNRETIVKEGLEKPTAIAVHPIAKKLFWTDTGVKPTVERASLLGSDRNIIANTNLVSPTGLTIDFTEDRLIWCDEGRGVVETSAMDGSGRRVLLENQVGRPLDLAVFEDTVWISDRKHQQLKSYHKRSGKELQRIHGNLILPSCVVVVQPLAKPGADVCLHQNGGCSQLCESKVGSAHCSCLPHYVLSDDGESCVPAVHSHDSALNNRTDNGDIRSDATETNVDVRPTLVTEKMVSDQTECHSLGCDVNAECHRIAGEPVCLCPDGYTGDGRVCVELPNVWLSTRSPSDNNSTHEWNFVKLCPSTHESYCLYQGICYYYPEVDSYACNCPSGYMGERCQFNNLEWWELQQSELQKRRTLVITASMMVFLFLFTIIAFLTYFYRTRRVFRKQAPADIVSDTSGTEEDTCGVISTCVHQQIQMASEIGEDTTIVLCFPKRAVCASRCPETGNNPFSEERRGLSQHNSTQHDDYRTSQSSTFNPCSSFKP